MGTCYSGRRRGTSSILQRRSAPFARPSLTSPRRCCSSAPSPDRRSPQPRLDITTVVPSSLSCRGPTVATASSAPRRRCRSTTTARGASTSRCRSPACRPPTRRTASARCSSTTAAPATRCIEFMHGDVHDVVPADVQARFDIVGFDPRGVGESTPVRCFADADGSRRSSARCRRSRSRPTRSPRRRRPLASSAARAVSATATCSTTSSTADVARDLDLLRRAVGDDQLTFAGYSYGGLIGLTYAQLYPDRVRAVLLDGAPGSRRVDDRPRRRPPRRRSASVSTATAPPATRSARSSTRCQAAGPDAARSPRRDTRAKFDALMAQLARRPDRRGPPARAGRSRRPDAAHVRVRRRRPPWRSAVPADLGRRRRPARGDVTRPPPTRRPRRPRRPSPDPAPAADGERRRCRRRRRLRQQPRGVARRQLLGDAQPARPPSVDRAPRPTPTGTRRTSGPTSPGCPCRARRGRPTRDDAVAGASTRVTANPMLFVNTRFDAASPLDRAAEPSARTPGARLLTVEGAGHPASFIPNGCVAAAVTALPGRRRSCPPPVPVCPAELRAVLVMPTDRSMKSGAVSSRTVAAPGAGDA